MPRNLDIDKWIQIAKFITTVGEMAPFPYIKGAAGCVTTILEAIEKAGKNDEDLRALADDIGTTMAIIKETIEVYLENLLSELNKTQHNLERKQFHRFLKTRKVADAINGYKQRMNDIKANYVVSLMTDARLEMPETRDFLSTRITDATEASRLRITSTVKAQSCRIIDEIHSLREIHREAREHTSRIFANLQNRKGYFKGEVRDLAPGDIYLIEKVPHNHQHGYCTVESSNTVKLIRIYQPHIGNEEDVMKQLDHDIDVFVRPRHPNIAQVFGVCRSLNLPAIIFHGHDTFSYQISSRHSVCIRSFGRVLCPGKFYRYGYDWYLHQ
ncbi:hypothetical protein ARMSODRAFT_102899 [Armillaria solidipes]|uniref:Uncharacterized protein n=1 Tax=Armillaria solidipes TaxID=1076256 RepID=A0A2H3B4F7_9AGAR|nr:hypothetical protein ARMSODRAFT_102899 [Armillaria solidipes]